MGLKFGIRSHIFSGLGFEYKFKTEHLDPFFSVDQLLNLLLENVKIGE